MLGNDLLEGELVRLTPLLNEDMPDFVRWFSSPEYNRYLGPITRPRVLGQKEAWHTTLHTNRSHIHFAIRPLEQVQAIGHCLIMDIRWQQANCNLGIGIGEPDYWGRGYGSDAMRVLLKYCFMELSMYRVGLSVLGKNRRALACYHKVGFVQEAISREAMFRDGVFDDWIQMSILRREWQARYRTEEN